MPSNLLLFIPILALYGCQSGISEKDQAIIKVLKQDLKIKENLAEGNTYIFMAKMDEYSERGETVAHIYNIQKDLLYYYDSLQINAPVIAQIDSLQRAFIKSYFYGVSDPPELKKEAVKDSLAFYLLKNEFLSRVIDLQTQLLTKMPDPCFKFSKADILFKLSKEEYKVSDTLKASLSSFYHTYDYTIKSCKLFRNGQLIAKPITIANNLQYGPLESGNYKIEIKAVKVNSVDFGPMLERSFDFTVK